MVGGACEGIATRDQGANCLDVQLELLSKIHSSAALGFVKRKGASRRTRYVDTKIYFMQAWTMEPGQRCTVTVNKSLTAPHRL